MSHRPEHQLKQHRLNAQYLRKLEQLQFEVRIESPRRVLDYLLDHLGDLLHDMDCTVEREYLREKLATARKLVSGRHNLRVVR